MSIVRRPSSVIMFKVISGALRIYRILTSPVPTSVVEELCYLYGRHDLDRLKLDKLELTNSDL